MCKSGFGKSSTKKTEGAFAGVSFTQVMYDFIILQRCLGNPTHMKTWYASEL